MKHEIENLTGMFKKLKIEVPSENVSQTFQKTYRQIQKDANLKGFRKGKAPLDIIIKNYGQSAQEHVVKTLVDETLPSALKEANLSPVAYPKIEAGALKEGEAFSFTAEFEAMPEVELKDYNSFKPKDEKIEVKQEEVDRALTHIQDRMAKVTEALEGSEAKEGSLVRISHKATEAGEDFPGASGNESVFEIGKAYLGKDFDEKLKGIKKDETREFTVKFGPEDQPFQDKTLDFTVTAQALMNKELPTLDEAFVKQVGPFENLEALKARILEDLKAEKEQQRINGVKEQYASWLVEQNPIEAPETLMKNQMEYLVSETASNLARSGMPQDEIEGKLKEWQDELSKRSESQVKTSMLLGAIAQKESIQASEEEIRNEIMRIAQQSGKKPQEIFEEFQQKGLFPSVFKQLTEIKTLDTMARKAVEQ